MQRKDLAHALGLSRARITQLAALGMPTTSVEGAARWRMQHLAADKVARPNGSAPPGERHRVRLIKAKADLAETEAALRRGELVDVTEVGEVVEKVFATFRARMLAFAPAVAPQIAPPGQMAEVQAALQRHVYATLNELADALEKLGGVPLSRDATQAGRASSKKAARA